MGYQEYFVLKVAVMAKICERCRREVSFRGAFEWQGKTVCRSCLSNLQSGCNWFDQVVKVDAPPVLKSLALAGILAFLFGPVGMLYVGLFWRALLGEVVFWCLIVTGALLIPNLTVFVILVIILWIVHVITMPMWAVRRAKELNRQIESRSLPV